MIRWRRTPGRRSGPFLAFLAALSFALSVPLGKVLLDEVSPALLAGLFYLGAGLVLTAYRVVTRAREATGGRIRKGRTDGPRAGATRHDLVYLAGATAAGGVAAPIVLLAGLSRTPAATASLLLSFEVVLTAVWARGIFHEQIDVRVWAAVGVVTLGGITLAVEPGSGWGISAGALAVVGACALWGLDNNLTRSIETLEPVRVAQLKGLTAGAVNTALGISAGALWPPPWATATALAVGGVGYGFSLVLFVLALRRLGAARTGAWFGVAPFLAAGLSLLITGESPGFRFFVAGALMAVGGWLMVSEQHIHEHEHDGVTHTHWHVPDTEHRHSH